MLTERIRNAIKEPKPIFLVFPAGASFDFALAPFGPSLVLGTESRTKATNKARKVGGTVERWISGETPTAVPTAKESYQI